MDGLYTKCLLPNTEIAEKVSDSDRFKNLSHAVLYEISNVHTDVEGGQSDAVSKLTRFRVLRLIWHIRFPCPCVLLVIGDPL